MTDILLSSTTAPMNVFDAVVLTLIIISALMALARGFLRELASLVAFVAGLAAAYYARLAFRDPLAELLPDQFFSWTADAILAIGAFLIVFIVLAYLGGQVSRHIQGEAGVGVVNRLAGLIFGVARGVVAVTGFVLIINLALKEEEIPPQIAEGRLYPYFADWADRAREAAPDIASKVATVAPGDPDGGASAVVDAEDVSEPADSPDTDDTEPTP